MDEIQRRRANVVVPGGRPLHEYACLYICGRNVMLYKRRGQHDRICVMQVVSDVLDLPGVVVTDANASSDYVRFSAAPAGLRIVDRELTLAESWTDADPLGTSDQCDLEQEPLRILQIFFDSRQLGQHQSSFRRP